MPATVVRDGDELAAEEKNDNFDEIPTSAQEKPAVRTQPVSRQKVKKPRSKRLGDLDWKAVPKRRVQQGKKKSDIATSSTNP